MTDEPGFLTEQQGGAEIAKLLAAEETPQEEKREVKFKARVKGKKPKAEPVVDDADREIVPLTPADGSDDPDRELEDDANPYKNEKKKATKEPEPDEEPEQDGGGDEDDEDVPRPLMVRVKEDGLEVEKPVEEVAKGYMRTSDYTRKTQALAEEKRRFVAEELEPTRAVRQEYLERLERLDAIIPHPGKEPNWAELGERLTPEEFQQQFKDWKALSDRYARVQQERDRVLGEQEADAKRAYKAHLATEHEKLLTVFPDWDTEKGRALKDDLVAYAKSPAFHWTDDDLAQVTDHRLLVLLDKARRWDEAQKREQKTKDKIDRALDTLKPSATKSKPKASETQRLEARLKETGSVEDAGRLISKLL